MSPHLKKAPTLLVIGVTGFVAYTMLFPDAVSEPAKPETKPPSARKNGGLVAVNTLRNPFQMVRPEGPVRDAETEAASTEGLASKSDPAEHPSEEDKVLDSMKLDGTYVDEKEQLAVINNKVYARGDQLRGPDGSMIPYIITEVRHDRAMVRRGRLDFEIAFSNIARTAAPRAPAAPGPAEDGAVAAAKSNALAGGSPTSKTGKGNGKRSQGGNDPAGQRELIQQLLSSLGGSQGGPNGLSTGAGGIDAGALKSMLTPDAINAGLDAIAGKNNPTAQEGGSAP